MTLDREPFHWRTRKHGTCLRICEGDDGLSRGANKGQRHQGSKRNILCGCMLNQKGPDPTLSNKEDEGFDEEQQTALTRLVSG